MMPTTWVLSSLGFAQNAEAPFGLLDDCPPLEFVDYDPQPIATPNGDQTCMLFVTITEYELNEEGYCELVSVTQSHAPWVNGGSCDQSSVDSAPDYPGDPCPDEQHLSWTQVTPETWCCSTCEGRIQEKRVPVDHTPGEDAWECLIVTSFVGEFCAPGDGTDPDEFVPVELDVGTPLKWIKDPAKKLIGGGIKVKVKSKGEDTDEDSSGEDDTSGEGDANATP